ncbi:MAG: sulfite exporter TauE/SafE family protein [Syntrophobacteraceae bacterium]
MLSLLIGLAAGLFGGLLGLGGGAIMIPLMVGAMKISQHKAHGTSLVALVFTGLAGVAAYDWHGSIDITASLILASTAIFTSRAGARFSNSLPEWKLKRSFGWFLVVISSLLILKPYLPHANTAFSGWSQILILLVTGTFTGFLSGMMGIGGGGIMVASMVLILGFSQYTAQGCSLLAMIPIGATGAFTYWRSGNVSANILPGLIAGIIVGSFSGGLFAHLLPEEVLRLVFSGALIFTGSRFLRAPRPSAGLSDKTVAI